MFEITKHIEQIAQKELQDNDTFFRLRYIDLVPLKLL